MKRITTTSLWDLDAVTVDMDGMVTETAVVHAAAWKRLFDAYLRQRAEETGEAGRPEALRNAGADVVVGDLAELEVSRR